MLKLNVVTHFVNCVEICSATLVIANLLGFLDRLIISLFNDLSLVMTDLIMMDGRGLLDPSVLTGCRDARGVTVTAILTNPGLNAFFVAGGRLGHSILGRALIRRSLLIGAIRSGLVRVGG